MRRILVLIVAAMSLTGCDSIKQAWSKNELSAIAREAAEDEADAQASPLRARLERLESKVDDLESEVTELKNKASR